MRKPVLIAAFVFLLVTGYRLLVPPAPERFPQFAEQSITSPGLYASPQWSPDSRYLAYLNDGVSTALVVYDTQTGQSWTAATDVDSTHYRWTPNGSLSYLKYRPDLSGMPFPIISDLHRVSRDGQNDHVIAAKLSHAGDFDWFSDGERVVITLTDPALHTNDNDLYLLNARTGSAELLLESKAISLDYIVMIALTPDEGSLLIYGIQQEASQVAARIVLYSLDTHTVLEQFLPREIIPAGNTTYPPAGIGDGTNAAWVGGRRWFLSSAMTPDGECHNYALFFFDMNNLQNSFCIPTREGIVTAPVIAPDLSRVSYLTVVGPGSIYVMLSPLPAELWERLELESATPNT